MHDAIAAIITHMRSLNIWTVMAAAVGLGLTATATAGISVFQNGVDGYDGTQDTEIRGNPNDPAGGDEDAG